MAVVCNIPYVEVEEFIVGIRTYLNQPTDWNSTAGRCIVRTIGPPDEIRYALKKKFGEENVYIP